MSRCILVIGVHRSGTSAVAGALHHLGVDMGTPAAADCDRRYEGWPAYDSNPKGQFEDDAVCKANRVLIGSDWRNPYPLLAKGGTAHAEKVVKAYVSKPLWGIKDPALCLTASVWYNALRAHNCSFGTVFVRRAFNNIVASMVARDSFPYPIAEHVAARYWLELGTTAATALGHGQPYLAVSYDELIADPAHGIARLADWALKEPVDGERLEAATSFIDPSLNHWR